MDLTLNDTQREIQTAMRRFADEEVIPVASTLEHAGQYPVDIVNRMA
jgi:hypothetical protein